VLGALSVKKLQLICLYPFLISSQMIANSGITVREARKQVV
jgi:hypothetical protein